MSSNQDQPTAVTTMPDVKVVVADDGQSNVVLLTGQWKAGLFSCCDQLIPNCLCACCCPCVSLAQIVARLGVGDFLLTAIVACLLMFTGFGGLLLFLYVFYLRYKFRTMLQIPGSACADCCAALCCNCCVLAQLATHADSYTPGKCDFNAKATLPGYSDMFSRPAPVEPTPAAGIPTKNV
ncbi:hypothetical protein DYB28_015202 [Aphanomyces astaci]|uniref:Uncharacterized protein n=1 Tax=Aphanomyces astaci TaxID=112090 RepID=A0A9X8DLH1_APHAT|nr:hypothetical protein DYB28_015202 [Aphanomyces astaci]